MPPQTPSCAGVEPAAALDLNPLMCGSECMCYRLTGLEQKTHTYTHTQHICNQLAHTQLKHIIASLSISSCSPSFNLVSYYKLVLNFIFSFF